MVGFRINSHPQWEQMFPSFVSLFFFFWVLLWICDCHSLLYNQGRQSFQCSCFLIFPGTLKFWCSGLWGFACCVAVCLHLLGGAPGLGCVAEETVASKVKGPQSVCGADCLPLVPGVGVPSRLNTSGWQVFSPFMSKWVGLPSVLELL
jgi:hypothetical protein